MEIHFNKKNGIISKPANLQSKLIDSFIYDTNFH